MALVTGAGRNIGRAIALALARDGMAVAVNCVSPGMIDTVREGSSVSAQPNHHKKHAPSLGRRWTAEEVADSVAWLAGPQARFVTGQVLHVNGGSDFGS